ncbi:hypothetical protein IW261DRAFT_1438085 [Armillaria novae-zelandiae]|uniref:Uncharacterized protein n=1 Tax=Armillaria novae-zelandiae TaxID=153914 RepID=A0AA39UKE2_9AGAR|nr:hypothetical protein IW261DRAFT_1438085 [Armillaria novae-zelandiae]
MADFDKRATRSSSKSRPRRSMSADSKREISHAESAAHFVSDIDLVRPQEPFLQAAGSKKSDKASVNSEERGRRGAQSDGSSSKTGKRAKSADALSCSALGAKSLAGISPSAKLSFSSYAHDRKIISLSNIPLGPGAAGPNGTPVDGPEEINEMLKFYEDTTNYRKPPIKKNESPLVDSGVEEVRDHFLTQIDEFPGDKNTPQLSQPLWEVFLSRLSPLLWASAGGYSKLLADKSPNEAEARHDWDVLLNFGFMAAKELASGRVVLERAVSLSRNIAADVMKASPNSNGAEFKACASQMHAISHAGLTTGSGSAAADDLLLQATEFSLFALKHSRASNNLFSNSATARTAILRRSGDEPELGIVDAILTVPLEGMQLVQEPLIRVAETRATIQASTRALSADNIAEPEEELAVSEGGAQTQESSRPGSKHAWSTKSRSQLASIAEGRGSIGRTSQRQTGKKNDYDWKMFQPFAVTCSEIKSATKLVLSVGVVMSIKDLFTKLLLAVLFAEYKKPTQTYAKAVVQAKLYLEASVRYLASLGVTKEAVFALATDGVEGALLMAWCSTDSETVYIVERNVRTFDISSPIEVYHFVTVLLRLREYGDTRLKKAVEAALKAEDFKQTSWNKTTQFKGMESV